MGGTKHFTDFPGNGGMKHFQDATLRVRNILNFSHRGYETFHARFWKTLQPGMQVKKWTTPNAWIPKFLTKEKSPDPIKTIHLEVELIARIYPCCCFRGGGKSREGGLSLDYSRQSVVWCLIAETSQGKCGAGGSRKVFFRQQPLLVIRHYYFLTIIITLTPLSWPGSWGNY